MSDMGEAMARNGNPVPTSEQLEAALTRCHLRYRRTGEQRWREAMREIQFAHLYFYGVELS